MRVESKQVVGATRTNRLSFEVSGLVSRPLDPLITLTLRLERSAPPDRPVGVTQLSSAGFRLFPEAEGAHWEAVQCML